MIELNLRDVECGRVLVEGVFQRDELEVASIGGHEEVRLLDTIGDAEQSLACAQRHVVERDRPRIATEHLGMGGEPSGPYCVDELEPGPELGHDRLGVNLVECPPDLLGALGHGLDPLRDRGAGGIGELDLFADGTSADVINKQVDVPLHVDEDVEDHGRERRGERGDSGIREQEAGMEIVGIGFFVAEDRLLGRGVEVLEEGLHLEHEHPRARALGPALGVIGDLGLEEDV